MKIDLKKSVNPSFGPPNLRTFRRRIVWPLFCAISAVFICATAQAQQVATPVITQSVQQPGYPTYVYMTDATPGATIFYTFGSVNGCTTPMHNANGTPKPATFVYHGPVEVPVNSAHFFRALGYKSGLLDSNLSACVYVDNIQQ